MRIYEKNGISINYNEQEIIIEDDANSAYIKCDIDNVDNLIDGLKRMKKDAGEYRNYNCVDGRSFFPTIGCNGNYIIISHIPKIIKAIKHGSKISFNISNINNLDLYELNHIANHIKIKTPIIKNDIVNIILYNIKSTK